jgi:altronate hydrolase
MKGFLRKDGRKGIRNITLVVYLVECAHHVAKEIVKVANDPDVQLLGFPGCYPNDYSLEMMKQLCTHPNVGGVIIVSLGCEGFNRESLYETTYHSGRLTKLLVIQENGGTSHSISTGLKHLTAIKTRLVNTQSVPIYVEDLVIGTICGGSDGTSGITANPAVGECFDLLVENGATCIFEETGELIGCEHIMAQRAATPKLAKELITCVEKAENYYRHLGYGSFAPGNADGGLTTQEEKSMGAYAKSGQTTINGIITPGQQAPSSGLYLMDVVPDGDPIFGFPNIADNAEIIELIASGALIILFTTGRGSVVGSAISPVIKVCANPQTYRNLKEDMDINAGEILEGTKSVAQIGMQIYDKVCALASGEKSASEALGHNEFLLTYKKFDSQQTGCFN